MEPYDLFEILVREHAEMLTVYLRSVIRDPAAADDLFQETMLTAWRTLDRFDRTKPFGPWLRGIARVLVLEWRRQTVRHPRLCDAEVLDQIESRMTEFHRLKGDTLDEKLDALRQCLSRLLESYRSTIELRYRDGLSLSEIEGRLGVAVDTIKKRLQRARNLLMQCLTGRLAAAGGPVHD